MGDQGQPGGSAAAGLGWAWHLHTSHLPRGLCTAGHGGPRRPSDSTCPGPSPGPSQHLQESGCPCHTLPFPLTSLHSQEAVGPLCKVPAYKNGFLSPRTHGVLAPLRAAQERPPIFSHGPRPLSAASLPPPALPSWARSADPGAGHHRGRRLQPPPPLASRPTQSLKFFAGTAIKPSLCPLQGAASIFA